MINIIIMLTISFRVFSMTIHKSNLLMKISNKSTGLHYGIGIRLYFRLPEANKAIGCWRSSVS